MHRLLQRQLKKSGLTNLDASPAPAALQQLLVRVSQSYGEADQERYVLERSLSISSREMQELSSHLRQERDRLTAVLNSLEHGLCALGRRGELLLINPEGERLLGWRESELLGKDLLALVGIADSTEAPYRHDDAVFFRKDGDALPVSFSLTPLISDGQSLGAVLVFRDITERKRALLAQTQLVRRDSLLRLARRFAAESDSERLLTDLLDEAVAVLGGDDGTLSRWDPIEHVLVPVRNTVPTASEFSVIKFGEGVSGRAAELRAPVVLNDYQRESGNETPAGRAGVRAATAVPLLHEGRLLGSLSVNTYDPTRRFTSDDTRVLELLAGIASAALASLERTAELARTNLELKQARDDAQFRALHDSLTGLPNRTLLRDRLQQAILLAQRDKAALALLIIDLDRFKDVNDTLGHQYGDELLQVVAARIQGVLRASDTVARMGGDEFAIILPAVRDEQGATHIAELLVRTLEQPLSLGGQWVSIGASVGVALCPQHGDDAKTLLRHADVAMYAAKRLGGGHAVYRSNDDTNLPDRLALIGDLRRAIDNDELFLHYQPKVSLRSGRCVHVEALVRWQHPARGLVPPDQFIGFAEETGLIKPLTRWVLNAALRQCASWQADGLYLPVAINLSMRNLQDPELMEHVAESLAGSGLEPAWLKVEVTESALMTDPQRARECLGRLREMGVEVAIDDFGTGHSSLSYLKHLPVSEIKLDRSFVRDMQANGNDYAIVRSTIELAHALGLSVVAEGVEDKRTWDLLADLGCDTAQGYYMSRPLPASDVSRWFGASSESVPAAAA